MKEKTAWVIKNTVFIFCNVLFYIWRYITFVCIALIQRFRTSLKDNPVQKYAPDRIKYCVLIWKIILLLSWFVIAHQMKNHMSLDSLINDYEHVFWGSVCGSIWAFHSKSRLMIVCAETEEAVSENNITRYFNPPEFCFLGFCISAQREHSQNTYLHTTHCIYKV